ncbi:MAG: FtsQ-type POTRA domain-containing protein [Candidatus Magasanikbacteria bacterium]|nr:FtsQ-type POTRA domain-containing protein [Candidatus Magasanikbacteria bacterium]MBT4314705.1 FtsQ-type POTRA domain-containing protein [Candidatus Magasanikbacteria bacterium]MBT4547482.1 FtsQ-type POTRA domain-containing protein [Candidatus Magasanikbacteria bacterium]MBT6819593.1 FtsQ-type POTRA domain-containing protein [Candidatus Magasanikbacteria bacterium]
MRRNIFNRHKYKRKWGRGFKKASNFLLSSDNDNFRKRKDFAWHNSKRNPMQRDRDVTNWKKRIEITILIISLFAMACLGLYSSFFKIKDVEINGLQRIEQTDITNAVFGVIDYNRLFIFPGESYFLVNVDEIKDILKQRFPLESIIVKKTFPNTLEIVLEEKISTVIYDNGREYSYLDTEGKIVEIIRKIGDDEWDRKTETVTTTNELGEEITEEKVLEQTHRPNIVSIIKEMGDYPIFYDTRDQKIEINSKVIDANMVSGAIEWFNFINKNTDIPFGYIEIHNGIGDAVIRTREGWHLLVKLDSPVKSQFEELEYTLKQKVSRENLNYIDLRFPGKVYWQ